MVPEVGDYHTLAAEAEGRVLVRNPNGVELLSNVCRHRQAIMLNGRGNAHLIPDGADNNGAFLGLRGRYSKNTHHKCRHEQD